MAEGPPTRAWTAWAVSDGAAGAENQCIGLAARLGVEAAVKRIAIRRPWRWLPPALWPAPLAALSPAGDGLAPPWPQLLIASGRKSAAPAAAIARAARGGTVAVQIQKPGLAAARFDLVVAPRHDRLQGANVVVTTGSVHGLTRALLDGEARRVAPGAAHLPRPLVFAAIGGANRAYRFDESAAAALGRRLAALPGGLLAVVSRRTGRRAARAIGAALDPRRSLFWAGDGPNPYRGWLGLADAVVVTADSVAMASEACATGRPVFIAELPGGSAKFRAFHGLLFRLGHARPLAQGLALDWTPVPLDDGAAVARRVRLLLEERFSW